MIKQEAGIDIIKAICIVLVLIWHLQPDTHTTSHVAL
jgi:uncharacterized membrane protein YcfT